MDRTQRKKLLRYHKILKKVDGFRDGLGRVVDPGIRKTVALFNLLGFKTTMSCAGHLDPDHGEIVPWVDLERKNAAKDRRIRSLIRSYWRSRMSKRRPDITSIWVLHDVQKRLRIQVGPDHFWNIQKEKRHMPSSVRRWFLNEGRKEMTILTNYLWRRYLGEL